MSRPKNNVVVVNVAVELSKIVEELERVEIIVDRGKEIALEPSKLVEDIVKIVETLFMEG